MNEFLDNIQPDTTTASKSFHLHTINGKDLMDMTLPPLQYTIDQILPHGFFILAGGAKTGKSWLAEQIAYAVAAGGKLWHLQATQSEVLYMGLEDTPSRLQERFDTLNAYIGMENIHFVFQAHTIASGIENDIREYLHYHPSIKLVIIDTLQHIRDDFYVKNIYAGDVSFTNILRKISVDYDLTLLALTHTNKGKHDDAISKISGSEGIAGGTDGNWVLSKGTRTDTRATLTISNRDTESFEFPLEFDTENCCWKLIETDFDPCDDSKKFLSVLCSFIDETENKHWEGTATDLLLLLQQKDPFFLSFKPNGFGRKLKNLQSLMQDVYNISYNKNYHCANKWITLHRNI